MQKPKATEDAQSARKAGSPTRWAFPVLAAVLGFSLGLDRLPLPGVVSVAPAAPFACALIVLALAYRGSWEWNAERLRMSQVLAFANAFVLGAVVITLALWSIFGTDGKELSALIRAAGKQTTALIAGFFVFIVLANWRDTTQIRRLFFWMTVGALPLGALAMLQTTQWQFGWDWAGAVSEAFRGPLGLPDINDRVTGLAVEPLSFAGWVVVVVLPMAFMGWAMPARTDNAWARWVYGAALLIFGVALIFTLSGTTYLLLVPALALSVVLFVPQMRRRLALYAAGTLCVAVVLTALFLPDVYALKVLREHSASTGSAGLDIIKLLTRLDSSPVGTISTKAGSTLDPIKNTFSSRVVWGYGLGGSAIYADEFLSPTTLAGMDSSAGGIVTLKTLFGRLWSELGIFGTGLAAALLFMAYRQSGRLVRQSRIQNTGTHVGLSAARVGLLVAVLASAATIGSYALPYIWFWLGVVAALELRHYVKLPTK